MLNYIERLLRGLATWIYSGVHWTTFLVLHALTLGKSTLRYREAWARGWGRTSLRLLGIRLILENENPAQLRGPKVAIINHQSLLDLMWSAAVCPDQPLAIGKKEIIWAPFIGLVFVAMGFIRIDRKNHRRAVRALDGVAETIRKESRSLFVAPEGTRSPTGELLPFKKGAFHLAIQAQAPVYFMVVHGAYDLMPKQNFLPRKGTLYIRFPEPISTTGMTLEKDLDTLVKRARSVVAETNQAMRLAHPNVLA